MNDAGIGGVLIMEVDQGAPLAGSLRGHEAGGRCSGSSSRRRTGWAWR